MKYFVRSATLAIAGVLLAAAPPLVAQAPKLAFVNVQQIMAQAPGLAEARSAFEREVQTAQPELQRMEAQLDSLQQEFQRQQATLTDAAKQQRQQDLQQRYATYQQRRAALQRREQELLQPITKRVEDVIEVIRKEGNFAMVFDTAQSGIVAADQSLDLTNRVLDRLKTTPAAAAAPAPR